MISISDFLSTQTWQYKDSSRYYWTIIAKPTHRTEDNEGYFHTVWEIEVLKEDDIVHENILESDCSEPISLHAILLDWLQYQNSVALGFAKYSEKNPKTSPRV